MSKIYGKERVKEVDEVGRGGKTAETKVMLYDKDLWRHVLGSTGQLGAVTITHICVPYALLPQRGLHVVSHHVAIIRGARGRNPFAGVW